MQKSIRQQTGKAALDRQTGQVDRCSHRWIWTGQCDYPAISDRPGVPKNFAELGLEIARLQPFAGPRSMI